MSSSATLREDQAHAVRERILAAALVVIEAGDEPTMRSVAAAAAISERTVYRYFASREALHEVLFPELRQRVSTPTPAHVDGLAQYIHDLFTAFDRNARLARALATASWAPTHLTRPANLKALRKIVDGAFARAPKADRESAAASLRVPLSAAGWVYLADCGFDLTASVTHAQWLTRTVLDKLARLHRGGAHA